jgi:hypothetical protein
MGKVYASASSWAYSASFCSSTRNALPISSSGFPSRSVPRRGHTSHEVALGGF